MQSVNARESVMQMSCIAAGPFAGHRRELRRLSGVSYKFPSSHVRSNAGRGCKPRRHTPRVNCTVINDLE